MWKVRPGHGGKEKGFVLLVDMLQFLPLNLASPGYIRTASPRLTSGYLAPASWPPLSTLQRLQTGEIRK